MQTYTETGAESPMNFTETAAQKVGQLIEAEGNSNLKLRIYIHGGGCSGFQYGFSFDEEIQDGDTEVKKCGVVLIIDPMSVQYLMGAELDYEDNIFGSKFIIRNPHSTTTCGCGSSFSV